MELTGKESNEIPVFLERLLAALPRMHEHHCGKGYRGGFVERLQEGTWFGHIVEHVCLEFDRLGGNFGQSRQNGRGRAGGDIRGGRRVPFRASNAPADRDLRRVRRIAGGRPYALDERIAEVTDIVARHELGPSTRS